MQIAFGIAFLVGGLLAVNWVIHLLFRPITPKRDDNTDPAAAPHDR